MYKAATRNICDERIKYLDIIIDKDIWEGETIHKYPHAS